MPYVVFQVAWCPIGLSRQPLMVIQILQTSQWVAVRNRFRLIVGYYIQWYTHWHTTYSSWRIHQICFRAQHRVVLGHYQRCANVIALPVPDGYKFKLPLTSFKRQIYFPTQLFVFLVLVWKILLPSLSNPHSLIVSNLPNHQDQDALKCHNSRLYVLFWTRYTHQCGCSDLYDMTTLFKLCGYCFDDVEKYPGDRDGWCSDCIVNSKHQKSVEVDICLPCRLTGTSET